jgi:phosphoribosylanthranilate isomerase
VREFFYLQRTTLFMTWVKICGMTNLEDALTAVDAGADAVGFVFYEKSPRNISVEAARTIVQKLPERVDKIGVFVNELPERVSAIADEAGLTAVQFHGDEHRNPERYSVNREAFFCLPAMDLVQRWKQGNVFVSFSGLPNLAGILLDSGTREQRGGTGKTFAWGEAYGFVRTTNALYPVIIAGGLTPTNVGWAVGFLKPWGVDVASGVEANPGRKDPEKVRAFVKAVRDVDRKTS